MAKFADILTRVKVADEDREAIIAITAKYPDLDSAVADAQEVTIMKSNWDKAQAALKKWVGTPESWYEKAWDAEHGMTRAQWDAEQRLATAQAQIAELQAGGTITGEGNMTFEEIDAHLKSKGVLTAADVTAFAKVEDVDKKVGTQGSNYEYLYTRTAHLPMKAMKEFGDVDGTFLPGLFQLMVTDPTGELLKDPEKAYEQYVAPLRLKAQQTKLDADRAAFDAKVAEDATKKAAAPPPTDAGEAGVIAPYQMMQDHPGDNVIEKMKGDAAFGSGQLGRNLAAAYKAGDLKTTVQ